MSQELYVRDAEFGLTVPVALSDDGELIVEVASGNVNIDPGNEPIVVIQHLENEACDGNLYLCTDADNAIAADAVLDLSVTTGSGITHQARVFFRAAVGGDARTYLYEGVTCSGGVVCTMINRNRRSSNTIDTDVRVSPTCSLSGATLLKTSLIPGGSLAALSAGAVTAEAAGWVLKPLTTYLYRVHNITAAAEPFAVGVSITHEEI